MLYYPMEGVEHLELPFEKTVCRYWKQKQYTFVNQEEAQEVRLPESMPDIGRIIASWAQVVIRGKDWRSGGVGVNGGVMVWVLYAPEEGGALQRIESWIPFQARTEFTEGGEDGVIRVESVLRSVDARNVSGRKLMLRVGIGLLIQTLIPQNAQISKPEDLPDDVEVLKNEYALMLTAEAGEKSFLMDEELNLPGGMPQPEQLVYFRMEPEVEEQKVLGSRAVFRGTGHLHMLFMDKDQKLCSHDAQIPFAQYMELEGDYEDSAEISTLFCVTSLELDVLPEGGLRLKCGLVGQYMIQAPTTVEILEDLYSPCRIVETQVDSMDIPAWLEQRQEEMEFSERFSGEDTTVIDQIFCPDLASITRQPDGVSVECGGTFQTLLQEKDGNYSGKMIRCTGQSRFPTGCDTVCFTNSRGNASCRREGSNWRVDTQVVLDLKSICSKPMEMVTGVKMGEVRKPNPERPSVIMRRREPGQSLWNLAKNTGSTVGAIRKMNKLEGDPEEDRLLLIPVI